MRVEGVGTAEQCDTLHPTNYTPAEKARGRATTGPSWGYARVPFGGNAFLCQLFTEKGPAVLKHLT